MSKGIVFMTMCLMAVACCDAIIVTDHGTFIPTVTSGHENVLRTPGNLGQVSTYSKTIDTPFSSVSKHDVRVTNPGLAYAHYPAPVHYATTQDHHYPAQAHHYPAPSYYAPPQHRFAHYAAPQHHMAHHHHHAAPPALLGVAYSAAPAVSHMSYNNGHGIVYAY